MQKVILYNEACKTVIKYMAHCTVNMKEYSVSISSPVFDPYFVF